MRLVIIALSNLCAMNEVTREKIKIKSSGIMFLGGFVGELCLSILRRVLRGNDVVDV